MKTLKENFIYELDARRKKFNFENSSNLELLSFLSYFLANPESFVALVDTYDWQTSGLPNYLLVSSMACDFGLKGMGIRLDSGDLLGDSLICRDQMKKFDLENNLTLAQDSKIIVSDGINLKFLEMINEKKQNSNKAVHSIDCFGIGTNLVNPSMKAVGFVMKLVQVEDFPVNKISCNLIKMNLPLKKFIYDINDGEFILMASKKDKAHLSTNKEQEFYIVDKLNKKIEPRKIYIKNLIHLQREFTEMKNFDEFFNDFRETLDHFKKNRKNEPVILYSSEIVNKLKFSL